jgi:hypothetical protein
MTTSYSGRKPRQSTFAIDTSDGYHLEATVKGFVDTNGEDYAGEILALAEHLYRDVFSSDFTEQILDLYEHKFQARIDEGARPSEFDLGWAAGRAAGVLEAEVEAQAKALETEDVGGLFPEAVGVGRFLKVTSIFGGHGFPTGTKVRVVGVGVLDDDGTEWLVTTREDDEDSREAWVDAWASGVTAWVGSSNSVLWVDTDDES